MTIQTMETIRFKNDGPTRKRLYAVEGMAHPAKGHLGLWAMMIEKYTKPGDTILDPMGGVGATLMAALMGRNVVVNEMEHHFLLPMVRSWAKMQQQPMLTGEPLGHVQILWGDARNLAGATPWPYQELAVRYPKAADLSTLKAIRRKFRLPLVALSLPLSSAGATTKHIFEGDHPVWVYCKTCGIAGRREETNEGLGTCPGVREPKDTFGLPLGSADSIITSPPYANSEVAQSSDGEANRRFRDGDYQGDALKGMGLSKGYTRPQSLPRAEHGVDAVVTSPPFQDQEPFQDKAFIPPHDKAGLPSATSYGVGNGDNIGNQKGEAYWASMRQVYAECWRVLRPGGVMALVLKGFTRDHQYVDLPQQTLDLLLVAGWVEHDHWRRELWSLSFWRILQKRRDPAAFDNRLMFEEVVVVRKPEGSGDGVAAVLTSPPYEGFTEANDEQRTHARASTKEIGDGLRFQGRRGYTRPGGG